MKDMSYYSDDTAEIFKLSGVDTCKTLFQINLYGNLVVVGLAAIFAIMLIIKIVILSYTFFIKTYVPHTATAEDEDIIVFS